MNLNYNTTFRNKEFSSLLAKKIRQNAGTKKRKIMEVCGGHTVSIFKYGLRDLLPENIELISGPGCPVCVTPINYTDKAIELARDKDFIITSYGDMLRVPGSGSDLLTEKSNGSDIRICYSALDALEIAKNNPGKKVVFLAVGFETTAPATALTILRAKREGISNFSVLCAHKTMPEAMRILAEDNENEIDAFICPGHVSVITGTSIFDFLGKEYKKPCVVSGFEPVDILQAIYRILVQFKENRSETENTYTRAATIDGNLKAKSIMNEVFTASDAEWKGLGKIIGSGLSLRNEYSSMDIEAQRNFSIQIKKENPACICGDVMKGKRKPTDCKLFAKACHPEAPKGACMVSDEGTCATYYKYKRAANER